MVPQPLMNRVWQDSTRAKGNISSSDKGGGFEEKGRDLLWQLESRRSERLQAPWTLAQKTRRQQQRPLLPQLLDGLEPVFLYGDWIVPGSFTAHGWCNYTKRQASTAVPYSLIPLKPKPFDHAGERGKMKPLRCQYRQYITGSSFCVHSVWMIFTTNTI